MIKITRETDYGIVLLTVLARRQRPASASALAKDSRLPGPMAGKILKTLTQAGLLVSRRGAHGGYSLARPAARISMTDVIEALEGPIALTACSLETDTSCAYLAHCGVSGHWGRINAAIRDALCNVTLAEMGVADLSSNTMEFPLVEMPLPTVTNN